MRKSLIFWLAAVTCAALFLVGCESPTNGEKGAAGANAPGTLPSGATPELLAAYFASTDKVFLVDDLDEGTFTVPAGKTLAVVGDVTLNNSSVINAYNGTLDVALGTIDGNGSAVIIVAQAAEAAVTAKVSNAIIPAYAAGVSDTLIAGHTALPSLTLDGTTAADFGDFAGSTHTVYVLGTLAIDAADTAVDTGSAKLVALGETTAAGANGVTFGANTVIGTLKATGALKITAVGTGGVEKLDLNGNTVTITADDNIGVITSGAADAVLTLPSDGGVGSITVGAYDIAIGGTPAAVTVAELAASGAGKLVLPAAAISFTATAGGGKIFYAAAPASLTLSSTTGLTHVGNLSTGAVTLTAGNLTVSGNATFTGALTGPGASGATITFNGETASVASYTTKAEASADTFAGSAALTIATLTGLGSGGESQVTFNSTGGTTVTAYTALETAKATTFAGTGALTITTLTDATGESKVVFNGPLTAVTNAVTPGTGGLIIGGEGAVRLEALPTITNALKIGNTAGVFIAGALVTGSSDTVTLTNAIFRAGSAASPISLTSASGSGVTLGEGDALALNTNDTIVIANSGKIAIGAHGEISGAGTWTATAGTDEYVAITSLANAAFIGASKRDGTTAETAGTLTATAGTAGVIKVAAEKTLVLGEKTTINVGGTSSKVGAIVLENHNSTPGKLVFDGTGAQITTGNSGGSPLSGAGGVFAASDSTTQDVVPVSAFSSYDYVTITGGEGSLTSIVFGGGEAYITGPKASGGSAATISAVTDCTS